MNHATNGDYLPKCPMIIKRYTREEIGRYDLANGILVGYGVEHIYSEVGYGVEHIYSEDWEQKDCTHIHIIDVGDRVYVIAITGWRCGYSGHRLEYYYRNRESFGTIVDIDELVPMPSDINDRSFMLIRQMDEATLRKSIATVFPRIECSLKI